MFVVAGEWPFEADADTGKLLDDDAINRDIQRARRVAEKLWRMRD